MNIRIIILSLALISTQTFAEDLTDIQITAPASSNAVIQNEAIQDIKTRNVLMEVICFSL